ncbi:MULTISPECIES: septal ring lytic transglycosylase RlpA family protein [Flavobacterium]|uniref:septal ring lytic transglycosylase RlpA family protein n=1 Tax=Flavobacterium TaxID=237 RepID=UPI001FCAD5AB|nr:MULTISPECIES: septal ring lytic transglycosylase RlpA family protein [Flavobacterium]UOK43282.1 septal ring lytic transglycosylase RlpA family protein [Flavobacterium enshiense]
MKKIIAPILLLFVFVFFVSSFASEKMRLNDNTKRVLQDTLKIDSTQIRFKYKPYKKSVHASYYHDRFNGRKTASGKRFDNTKYTAAHKKLPFGTALRITNPVNNKSVVVTVIDRGPFTRGREIDLSKKAFMEISHAKGRGFIDVNIDVVK